MCTYSASKRMTWRTPGRAADFSRKAASAGFEWETVDDVWAKVDEEVAELKAAYAAAPKSAPVLPDVTIDDFAKCDMRVCKVLKCEPVKKSDKLLRFTLDDGTGTDRQILSGIHKWYEPEQLVGKTLVAIVNLPPRKMMGLESCGMLLSATHTEKGQEVLNLIMVDDKIPAGAKLY